MQEIRSRFEGPEPAGVNDTPNPASFESILNQVAPGGGPKTLSTEMDSMIQQSAQSQSMDPDLIKAVIHAESGFNPNAVSKAGAQGLMQLMPGTARGLGVDNSFDPAQNLEGGTKYLKNLMNKYHSLPNALAAYNAGPGAVDKYGGIPPYEETTHYVKKVMNLYQQYANEDKAGEINP